MSDRPCEICSTGEYCTDEDMSTEPGCPFKRGRGDKAPYAHMEQPQRVCITWKNPRHDWPWYRLLGSLGELVHLQGADYPDGRVKHRGDSFWVHFSEIESMVDG